MKRDKSDITIIIILIITHNYNNYNLSVEASQQIGTYFTTLLKKNTVVLRSIGKRPLSSVSIISVSVLVLSACT